MTVKMGYEMEDKPPKVGDIITIDSDKYVIRSFKYLTSGNTWDEYMLELEPKEVK